MAGPERRLQAEEGQRWLQHAERGIAAAERAIAMPPALPDIAAYHCQQAVEKLLKGLLVAGAIRPRKTHDLDFLADEVGSVWPALAPLAEPLRRCTTWGFAYRYPLPEEEPAPTVAEIRATLAQIEDLRRAVVGLVEGAKKSR
ncbi:HEPN domain-containing protein [Geminicoccus roseus]|uniref:HEPN domain-containing protein n=1 Tax=Geminicoccus roseus TaxID=404900 RepID=UPI0006877366|nr:HEPN domain-containing protein [Geminicoccus roseus]